MNRRPSPIRVSILAISESLVSPISGLYETFNCFPLLHAFHPHVPKTSPFKVEIVTPKPAACLSVTGLPLGSQQSIDQVTSTDVVIVPSMMMGLSEWTLGQYPKIIDWLVAMHDQHAMLCSACTGAFLLAETGLLDGLEATVHWAFAPVFQWSFPKVRLQADRVLIASGDRRQFVMSGASASWHDLMLYLIARHTDRATAQAVAKFMLLEWHSDGQTPYFTFTAPTAHEDAVVHEAQEWLHRNYSLPNPVDKMARKSGLPERSFKRRFLNATGYSPIQYVQHLRIEEAKQHLESTSEPVDDIGWNVGYQEPAFFRRLFKRLTGISPGGYRRKFRIPAFTEA